MNNPLFRAFPLALKSSQWFSLRFSPTGAFIWSTMICAGLFALNITYTATYQLTCICIALLATSILFSVRWRPLISVSRSTPDFVTAGETGRYRLTITNHAKHVERDILIRDTLVENFPSYQSFRQLKDDAGDPGKNWFDSRVGFPRWIKAIRRRRGAAIDLTPVPPIPARGSISIDIEITPLRRGLLNFEAIEIYKPDPLGLYYAKSTLPLPGSLLALPKRYPVPPIDFQTHRHFHRGGLSGALAVGDSLEFKSIRDFRPGDSLRHIHWRNFARLGTPVIKEFQDEYFDRHALVIDCYIETNAETNTETIFDAMISIAASFAVADRPQDSLLDIVLVKDKTWRLTAGRGLGETQQVLTFLANAEADPHDYFALTATSLQRYAPQLASIILILGHWDNEREQCVRSLLAAGLTVVPILLSHGEHAAKYTRLIDPSKLATDLLELKLTQKPQHEAAAG